MRKKTIVAVLFAGILLVSMSSVVLAAGFGLSPTKTEFNIPANGSSVQKFFIRSSNSEILDGDIEITLVDIPLRVEPEKTHVVLDKEGTTIELTFYGNESLGDQEFNGIIIFRLLISDSVGAALGIKATVHQIGSVQGPSSQLESEQLVKLPEKEVKKEINPNSPNPIELSEKSEGEGIFPSSWFLPVMIASAALIIALLVVIFRLREKEKWYK